MRSGNGHVFGGNRYLVPFIRGIATTSLRTGLAMTENFGAKPLNNNLSFRGLVFARAMQKPRDDPGLSQKRRGKNEKDIEESIDYIVSRRCEEKKGINIKFL